MSPDRDGQPTRVEPLESALLILDELSARDAGLRPRDGLRQELLDLADAPRLPLDTLAYAWEEPFPGIRICEVRSDPSRLRQIWFAW